MEDLKFAPMHVQIEWERDIDDATGEQHDLTSLCVIHAMSPTTTVMFVPYRVASNWAHDEPCFYCINEMGAAERGETEFVNPIEECSCAPPNSQSEEWTSYQYTNISRTANLHGVIMNDNPAWLNDLRAQKITIQARFGWREDPIEFRIRFKERFCDNLMDSSMSFHTESAWEKFEAWGLSDLSLQPNIAFVFAFESESRSRKGKHEILSREVREVRIGMDR
jgi:hypothetical protein